MQISVNPSRAISNKLCKRPDGTTVEGFTVDDTDCTYSTAKHGTAPQGRALMSLPGKTVRMYVYPPYTVLETQAYAKEYFQHQFNFGVPDTSGDATPLTRVSFSVAVDDANQVLEGKVLCDAGVVSTIANTHDPSSVRCDVDAKTKTATVTFLNEDSTGGVLSVTLGLKAKRSGLLSIDTPYDVLPDGTILSDVTEFEVRLLCVAESMLCAEAHSLSIFPSTHLRIHRRWRRPVRPATACARPTRARWATPTVSAARSAATPPT